METNNERIIKQIGGNTIYHDRINNIYFARYDNTLMKIANIEEFYQLSDSEIEKSIQNIVLIKYFQKHLPNHHVNECYLQSINEECLDKNKYLSLLSQKYDQNLDWYKLLFE